jgi:acyl transferase domain-containing protein
MEPPSSSAPSTIAVVGLAGRFPGARTVGEYWRNLCDGVESVVRYSNHELVEAGEDAELLRDPNYVRMGAPLADMELFDAGFFGFSARDAAILDPQHRHFLEVCWEALEDAGHVPESFPGAIGVFAGSGMQAYFTYHLAPNRKLMRDVGAFLVRHTGNDKDFLTTRVSYCLNLRGPSVAVQTACSTSLVAIHTAAQSLLNGECDLALAGGVTIELPHRLGYVFHENEILSPDGHCRAFDHDARGTIFGSGAGVVVLRRADDAFADGDTIYALLRGSAVNNDGRGKVSYLAPSLDGQAQCVAEALAVAGVPASSISYVEAHGTGTPVGDPIEVAALTQAFGRAPGGEPWCGLGSMKTNVGHLDTAAGVASFIKVALALRHRQIPASLNFAAPNQACAFEQSPFYVNTSLTRWATDGTPRRAGVNSLGVGGTNAHVILEEAPELAPRPSSSAPRLLCLSARSPAALDVSATRLAEHLRNTPGLSLADVEHTLQVGRRHFRHRRTIACLEVDDAVALLESPADDRVQTGQAPEAAPPIVFMFPGGGAQHPNMGRELYDAEPVFREHVDRILGLVESSHGVSLASWLFPAPGDEPIAAAALEQATASLFSTFAIEYALAALWRARGVEPAALAGHSLGEVVAACVAGVMSLPDALAIVAARGRMLDRLPDGATVAVAMSEEALVPLLGAGLSIAAVNGPVLCVVSGSRAAIEDLEATLAARDVDCKRLRLAFAAHSSLLDESLADFAREIAAIRLQPPQLPVMSNETGRWATADEITRTDYWVRQLRHTVRFADGLARVLDEFPTAVLLEVGPGTTLTSLALQQRGRVTGRSVVPSMRHRQDATSDRLYLLGALGRLWLAGHDVDWARQRGMDQPRRVPLPTYPFEHARHWIDRPAAGAAVDAPLAPASDASATRLPSVDDWFSTPAWRQAEPPADGAAGTCLVFDDADPLHAAIRQGLAERGDRVVRVSRGETYEAGRGGDYLIRPAHRADYDRMLADLIARGERPSRVAHLWNLGAAPDGASATDRATDAAFFSLMYLAQALGEVDMPPLHLAVVANGMQRVASEPVPHPERALSLGPCLVIPKEYDSITCSSVDWTIVDPGAEAVASLVREIRTAAPEPVVALRDDGRWLQTYRTLTLPKGPTPSPVRPGGVYLVTGGLGSLGLTLAEELARTPGVKLALVGRRALPDRATWSQWERSAQEDETATTIRRLSEIERRGATLEILTADVTDQAQLDAAVAAARSRFGPLNGVIHAAGVLDDGPIQLKEPGAALAVLAPKVHGTLALERAVGDVGLDFFVVYSSTSTVLGPAGQVDYVAANAFLNAFAISRDADGRRTRAIAWGAWADQGMAFKAVHAPAPVRAADPMSHPLLGRPADRGPSERVFQTRYDPQQLWALDEHRLADGTAVLPGSGFVELFRAAWSGTRGFAPMELRDVQLMAPLHLGQGQHCDVRVGLTRNGHGWDAVVSSLGGEVWQDHARATLVEPPGPTPGSTPVLLPISRIAKRCVVPPQTAEAGLRPRQERHLRFGPRWNALRSLQLGTAEAIAWFELPTAFAPDLDVWLAHPALVDLALHAGLPLVTGDSATSDLFVPLTIGAVRFLRPVPARFYSHARLKGQGHALSEVVSFDVTIADESGQVLVEVDELVLRRLDARTRAAWTTTPPAVARRGGRLSLTTLVQQGIRPSEGADVFYRALGVAAPACVVASPLDLSTLVAAERPAAVSRPGTLPEVSAPATAAPRDDYERALCGLWSELLGAPNVGIHDNFFDLGGHSLIAVRLFSRIRKLYSVSFGLAVLFEAPTVAACAALLRKELGTPAGEPSSPVAPAPVAALTDRSGVPMDVIRRSPCLVPIQPNGARRPLFTFPGIGGNVVGFQALTKSLPPDQPVIGLQSLGVDGGHQPLLSMREIAAHFITELRSVQPVGPYLLGGFSFGGIVGLEVAQQLQAAGDRVELLALFDTLLDSTDFTVSRGSARWLRWLEFMRRRVAHHSRALLAVEPRLLPGYLAGKSRTIRRRIRSRVWREVFAIQEAVLQTNDDEPIDLMPSLRRVRDANVLATKRYFPVPYPGVVTLFRAMERGLEPVSSDANWRYLAPGGLTVVDVPGNHLTMLEAPNVWVLGSALDDAIGRAQRLRDQNDALTGWGAAESVLSDH